MYYGRTDFDALADVPPAEAARRAADIRARLFPPPPRVKHPKPVVVEEPQPVTYADLRQIAGTKASWRLIVNVVSRYYGVSIEDLNGRSHKHKFSKARHVAMHLMRVMTTLSIPQIAQCFGGRDHTTAVHGTQRILELLGTGHPIDNDITALTEIIGGLVAEAAGK